MSLGSTRFHQERSSPMLVKFHSASWQSILAALAVIPLLGLASVPRVSAQSRISVSVSPATASVRAGGGTQQFTATVHNDWHHRGVRWTLSGAGCSGSSCGTLSATTSASGAPLTYTAPECSEPRHGHPHCHLRLE